MDSVWITWERQQRNISMARLFGARYIEFNIKGGRIKRYFIAIISTIKKLKESPSVVFCQNPSIILSLLCVTVGRFYVNKVVIDAHNSGVNPLEGKYLLLNRLNLWVLRKSDLVIVSNKGLCRFLETSGIKAVAMPDPLPEIHFHSDEMIHTNASAEKAVFVICSWSEDEPIELYMNVARLMKDVNFYFTGNYKKYYKENPNLSSNVSLLGFISEDEYFERLTISDVVLDLTTRDDCLVCGAYEAISACVPIVLTNTQVNKETFPIGTILSDLNERSLEHSIRIALEPNYDRNDIVKLKELLTRLEVINKKEVLKIIEEQMNAERVA